MKKIRPQKSMNLFLFKKLKINKKINIMNIYVGKRILPFSETERQIIFYVLLAYLCFLGLLLSYFYFYFN